MPHRLVMLVIAPLLVLGVGGAGAQETGPVVVDPPLEEPPVVEEPADPPADMSFAAFVERRWSLLHRVRDARRARCRSADVAFRLPSSAILPWRRAENLDHWRGRLERVRARSSKCFPAVMRRRFERIPAARVAIWMAIHRCEGSWSDPNAPYYGGLQFGWPFMRAYGADALRYYGGPANLWPWFVQIVVAERAVGASGAGFAHWPWCGRAYY